MSNARNCGTAEPFRAAPVRARTLFALSLLVWGAAAHAEVEIAFYSKDLAKSFPHAFVRLTGTVDTTGETVDDTYGFTPHQISLSMLSGPVDGMIGPVSSAYRERSYRHFGLKLSDAEYGAVLGLVERWRSAAQPSYYLNGRNCVNFVQEVAVVLGLSAPDAPKIMKKPKRYLMMVTTHNSELIRQWPSRVQPIATRPSAARLSTP